MGTDPQEQEPGTEDRHDTIPGREDGVGIGAGKDANTFEPEEDIEAAGEE